MRLLDAFLGEFPDKIYAKCPKLFYLMGHSWEFTVNDNWDVIEKIGEKFAKRKDIWHATNVEIYDYVQAYNGLIFSANGDKVINNSSLDVYLWIDGKNVLARAGQTSQIINNNNVKSMV